MDKPRVIVVEDDPDLVQMMAELLEELGMETSKARDGQEALHQIRQTSPDLVILDMHLPGLSGAEIIKKIRADQRLVNTKIVLMTADVTAARSEHQADWILLKPVNMAELNELNQWIRGIS